MQHFEHLLSAWIMGWGWCEGSAERFVLLLKIAAHISAHTRHCCVIIKVKKKEEWLPHLLARTTYESMFPINRVQGRLSGDAAARWRRSTAAATAAAETWFDAWARRSTAEVDELLQTKIKIKIERKQSNLQKYTRLFTAETLKIHETRRLRRFVQVILR